MSRARRYVAQNKRKGRIFFLSAVIVHFENPATGLRTSYVRRPGKTYRRHPPKPYKDLSGRQRRKARKAARREMK